MRGGVAAPAEEVRGTDLSWVLVFNSVVLALPWSLRATRAKEALVSSEILACFPDALAQHPALDCAVQGGGELCREHRTGRRAERDRLSAAWCRAPQVPARFWMR